MNTQLFFRSANFYLSFPRFSDTPFHRFQVILPVILSRSAGTNLRCEATNTAHRKWANLRCAATNTVPKEQFFNFLLVRPMDTLQRLFKSVSGKTRLEILLLLLYKGELSVSNIAMELDRKISTISRNLTILEKDNFVKARYMSSSVYYSIKEIPGLKYNKAILQMLKNHLKNVEQ